MENVLNNSKPDYGKRVIEEISTRLMMEYGQGYDKTAVTRMIQFYKLFPSYEKVATLSQ